MSSGPLPEEILDRFRSSSRERLARVAAVWTALSQGVGDESMASEMQRHVHTLKGDARLVQFHDINLVAQKLEDVLSVAADLHYVVPESIDFVVTMAIDFIGLLLRRRADQAVSGIDLPGFCREAEKAIVNVSLTKRTPGRPQRTTDSPPRRPGDVGDVPERLSDATRLRLAESATNTFMEYLSAMGASRTRLRSVWLTLQREIERLEFDPIAPLLRRHVEAAPELAASLDKDVRVSVHVPTDIGLGARGIEAVDLSLVHLLRNAIDHGIEDGATRTDSGKPAQGSVTIRGRTTGDIIELVVEDDGRGIDVEQLREKSVELGLLHPDLARTASEAALFDILFQPRFSTREQVDGLSGRGVGLDAVRTAVTQAGGTVTVRSKLGKGSSVSIRLPRVVRRLEVYQFSAYGGRILLAVPVEGWECRLDPLAKFIDKAIDPLAALQVSTPSDVTGMSSTGPPRCICFTRGGREVRVIGGTVPGRVHARRICPTTEGFAAEVVLVGGAEVLLVRPELLEGRSQAAPPF